LSEKEANSSDRRQPEQNKIERRDPEANPRTNQGDQTMTAQQHPAAVTSLQPMLEFNAAPTRENLTAISKLGNVAARVRFSIKSRSVEKFKPSPRHRKEVTRTVDGSLELTVRVVGREQAPITMTARSLHNMLEIYRSFEGQLFKLEVIRQHTYGPTVRVWSIEDLQAQYAAQSYGQTLEQCRTRAEAIVNSRIIVEGLVYAIAREPVYVVGLGDTLISTDEPFGPDRPDLMNQTYNALEREAAVIAQKQHISKRRQRKTGGLGAVIHVLDSRAVQRPNNQTNRQAVEDEAVRKTLERVRSVFNLNRITETVEARVVEELHAILEQSRAKRQPKPAPPEITAVIPDHVN
jgi:hypothetical protein